MDTVLFGNIHKGLPEFNRDFTRGLACVELKHVEDYVERIIRCAELRFPPGLRYSHCEVCSPTEAFNFATVKKTQKTYYELSQTDVYLMKYYFEFNGKPLPPRYLFLPYVTDGGMISIRGKKFSISPVLADIAISASDDNIFIPLNLDKLTFRRVPHHVIVNERATVTGVVHSEIYHISKKSRVGHKKTINALSTIPHYLFAKYGVTRTFSKYLGIDIKIGKRADITTEAYPPDKYEIFESIGVKPYGMKVREYTGPDLRIALESTKSNTTVQSLMGGLFYVLDRFPDTVEPDYLDSTTYWRTLLGHVIFASDESEGKLRNKIDVHMESLDGYIDAMSQEWLKEDGVHVNELYDLLFHVIDTFVERTSNASATASTMYGKRLMVLRYVTIDIIKAIFNMMFSLQTAAKKSLTEKDVIKIMDAHFKPHIIHRINHKHGEVSSVSNPGPCMSFKVTANLVLQTNITSGTTSSKSNTVTSANILHASIAEIGQSNNLPKGEPTGRRRGNMFMSFDENFITLQKPKFAELLNAAQASYKR